MVRGSVPGDMDGLTPELGGLIGIFGVSNAEEITSLKAIGARKPQNPNVGGGTELEVGGILNR